MLLSQWHALGGLKAGCHDPVQIPGQSSMCTSPLQVFAPPTAKVRTACLFSFDARCHPKSLLPSSHDSVQPQFGEICNLGIVYRHGHLEILVFGEIMQSGATSEAFRRRLLLELGMVGSTFLLCSLLQWRFAFVFGSFGCCCERANAG